MRFEYAIINCEPSGMAAALAKAGEEGWELVAVVVHYNHHYAYLKRSL